MAESNCARGGIQELLLLAKLQQAGMSFSEQPGRDVQVVYPGFPDSNQALLGKNLDAILQSEPRML